MNIVVKEIEPCKLSICYEANGEAILNKRAEVISMFKKAPVPGFRPNKASVDAIKVHYRTQIEDALKRALIEDAYHNTLFEKKLRPHGAPKINSALLADGKFICEFDLNTKPNFELAPYLNLEVPKPHEEMNDVQLTAKLLQELRVRNGEMVPYTEGEFVQQDDTVIVDYDAFLDGTKLDNLSGQGEMLTIGSSQFPEFDNNLLGMTVGETREFNILVPATGLPSLANKVIHFVVTLHMGSKNVPCALDDTLAQKVGKKDFAELQSAVQMVAQARVAEAFHAKINESISHQLVNANIFIVPNWMALSEAQYLTHQAKLVWDTLPDIDKEKYLEIATRNVKLSLILDKIREVEAEAQLSDQEVFDMIKQNIARHTPNATSFDDVIKEMNRTGYLQILMSRIRDEYALSFIVKKSRIVE